MAALHAIFHGNWTGIVTAPQGGRALTQDASARGQMMFALPTPDAMKANPSAFAFHGDTLQWTQQLKDRTCMATLLLSAVREARETIAGTMVCDHDNLAFKLQRKAD